MPTRNILSLLSYQNVSDVILLTHFAYDMLLFVFKFSYIHFPGIFQTFSQCFFHAFSLKFWNYFKQLFCIFSIRVKCHLLSSSKRSRLMVCDIFSIRDTVQQLSLVVGNWKYVEFHFRGSAQIYFNFFFLILIQKESLWKINFKLCSIEKNKNKINW